jgi:hypothetical protein
VARRKRILELGQQQMDLQSDLRIFLVDSGRRILRIYFWQYWG